MAQTGRYVEQWKQSDWVKKIVSSRQLRLQLITRIKSLEAFQENLKAQMDRVRFLSLPDATPIKKVIDQHHQIANEIQTGNQKAACAAMRTHLREILVSLPRLAEHHKDLFTKESCLKP